MPELRFGVSTRLFHDAALSREHLVHIAAHDFECIELAATRSHFDYRHEPAVRELQEWLADTSLTLHSVHAPVSEAVRGTTLVGPLSTASSDGARRQTAVDEALAALSIARVIPFRYLVVHLGVQAPVPGQPPDNQRDAARRSAETLIEAASQVGVTVAFELMGNPLSSAETLVHFIEETLDDLPAAICLDYGHGHLTGDLPDVIEIVGGHLGTTHVHDNDGRRDQHLMPFGGSINWDAAMMETQKVGYDGVLMFEVVERGEPSAVLTRAARARDRLAKALVTF